MGPCLGQQSWTPSARYGGSGARPSATSPWESHLKSSMSQNGAAVNLQDRIMCHWEYHSGADGCSLAGLGKGKDSLYFTFWCGGARSPLRIRGHPRRFDFRTTFLYMLDPPTFGNPFSCVYFSILNIHGCPYPSPRSGTLCFGPTISDTMKLWTYIISAIVALPAVAAQETSLIDSLAKFPGCAVS